MAPVVVPIPAPAPIVDPSLPEAPADLAYIVVNEAGNVVNVEADQEGSAYDASLVACIGDALKAAHFPKPGGMATVTAPLVFRP